VRYIFYMSEVRYLEVMISIQKFLVEYMHFV